MCFEVQALIDFTLEETIENFVLGGVIETFSSSYSVNGFNNTLSLDIVDTDCTLYLRVTTQEISLYC